MATESRTSRAFFAGVVTAALLAAVALLVFRAAGGSVRIDASRPAVLRQIQSLQRLETVVFGIDKIVTGERASAWLPRFLAGDRLVLIVFGQVVAGIDLARLQTSDVNVSGRSVTLHLPETQIFSAHLDDVRTRVYSRDTGLFSRVDPALETDVRKDAELQIRQAALDGNILATARANATTTLASFLRGLGFEQVEIQ